MKPVIELVLKPEESLNLHHDNLFHIIKNIFDEDGFHLSYCGIKFKMLKSMPYHSEHDKVCAKCLKWQLLSRLSE